MMIRNSIRTAVKVQQLCSRQVFATAAKAICFTRPALSHSKHTQEHDKPSSSSRYETQPIGLGDQSTRKHPSMSRVGEDDINDRVRNAPTLNFDANRLNEPRPSGEQSRQTVPGGVNDPNLKDEPHARDSPSWKQAVDRMPDLNLEDQSRRSNADIESESILRGQNDVKMSSDANRTDLHVSAGGKSRSSESIGAPGTEFTETYVPGVEQARGSDYQGQAKSYNDQENIQARNADSGFSQQNQQDGVGGRLGSPFAKTRDSREDINRQALGSEPSMNAGVENPITQAAQTIAQGLDPVLSKGKEMMDNIRDTVKSILDPDQQRSQEDLNRRDASRMDDRSDHSNRSNRSDRNN